MKTSLAAAFVTVPIAAMLCACTPHKPTAEAPRTVRTVELRYDKAQETNRYVGTVQARHEVDQAFRVGGKVVQRRVDVGQAVQEDDVLAVLDDTDYRLAEEAARQEVLAAETHARQAESDRRRLNALKSDGSVSPTDDEHAQSGAQTAQATAEAEAQEARARSEPAQVHRAARVAEGCRHGRTLRGRPGCRRGSTRRRHCQPRRA